MEDSAPDKQAPATPPALLDFDVWAELAARLMDLPMHDKVAILDERGIELADWLHSDKHHLAALSADAGARRMERAQVYAQKCVAEMERRANAPAEEPQGSR